MEIIGKIDELGKGAWIALMVLSFIVFWPVGLALSFFLLWSGRMGFGAHCSRRWRHRMRSRRWSSSGNVAFDEYRDETLKRLEEEQEEFADFLHRLRHAKDRAEFEQFMAERGRPRPPNGSHADPDEPIPST